MGFVLIWTICTSLLVQLSAVSGKWDYDRDGPFGPQFWKGECNLPTSTHQSPVNIEVEDVVHQNFPIFNLRGYENVDAVMTNNGHSVQVTLDPSANAVLSGGGLDGSYKLAHFHFHWGSTSHIGSEHEINGQQFPMEVHFVHYNTKYGNVAEAASKSDGLAILAWMFEVMGMKDNHPYQEIFGGLQDVKYAGGMFRLRHTDIHHFLGHVDKRFYRYSGSLTTPPCYQSVTWTVFASPLQISTQQMQMMRQVMSSAEGAVDQKMYNNFRPLKPLNDRKVYVNNQGKKHKRRHKRRSPLH